MTRPPAPGRLLRVARAAPRPAAAVCGGLLLFLAFPPLGAWPLAPPGAALVLLAVHGQGIRKGALFGFLFGLAFFLPFLTWLRVIGWDAAVALSVIQALFVAALGAALAAVTRLPGWPAWSAALWVAEESVRDRVPFGGFPWGRLAFSQGSSPFTPYAALGGAPLVTFAVALAGGLLAWVVLAVWRRHAALSAVGLVGVLAVPAAAQAVPLPTDGTPVTVAAVQGNVPHSGVHFLGRREAVLRNHAEQTHRLASLVRAGRLPRPDVVIWPENASDIDPYVDPDAHARIESATRDVGVPVLVGAVVHGRDPQHVRNMGIVWDPKTGPGETYTKQHLVPFGEYVPFRDLLTHLISRFQLVPRDFAPGDRPGVLDLGPFRVGDAICFEVADDGIVREGVTLGGRLLVVQTNNATYGRTGQPEQQLAIERLRAVEHGRATAVAATSGISAIIAPDGRLLEASEEFVPDLLVQRVPLRDGLTLADRLGAAPEWALTAVGVLAVFLAAALPVARRRSISVRPVSPGSVFEEGQDR